MLTFTQIKFPLAIICTLTITVGSFFYGKHYSDLQHELITQQQVAEIERLQSRTDQVTEKVVTKYKDRIQTITETKTEYAQITTPSNCNLTNQFVSLHNTSSQGLPPSTTQGADDTRSSITDAQAITTITDNYLTYNQVAAQLTALQDWIRQTHEPEMSTSRKSISP